MFALEKDPSESKVSVFSNLDRNDLLKELKSIICIFIQGLQELLKITGFQTILWKVCFNSRIWSIIVNVITEKGAANGSVLLSLRTLTMQSVVCAYMLLLQKNFTTKYLLKQKILSQKNLKTTTYLVMNHNNLKCLEKVLLGPNHVVIFLEVSVLAFLLQTC